MPFAPPTWMDKDVRIKRMTYCRLRNVPAANKNEWAETARSQLFRSDIIYVYIHTSQDNNKELTIRNFFLYNTFTHMIIKVYNSVLLY